MPYLYLTADQPSEFTGGGKVVANEIAALQSLGETTVISRNELGNCQEPWGWDEKAVGILPDRFSSSEVFFDEWGIKLCHGYAGSFGKTIKKLKEDGTKICWTVAAHDIEVSRREHYRLGMDFPYQHLTNPELWSKYSEGYRLADVLIAPGQAPLQTLRKQGFTQRIEIIPHGVDLPEEVKPFPKMFTVGYLGAYGVDKGIVYLMAAWKKLAYKDSLLILAGKDSEAQFVRDMHTVYGGGNVWFTGWQKTVSDFYNDISLYVQPSATEGYGIEVNESAAHGRPVVCSTGAGAADLVVEGVGLRFPACNVDELAERIDWYKHHQDKIEEHGKNAREKAKEVAWGKVKERYVEIWKTML